MARCSPRARSTRAPNSRRCWPPRSAAVGRCALERLGKPRPAGSFCWEESSRGRFSRARRPDERRGGPMSGEGGRIADAVAASSSRRGFLARVGAAVMGVTGAKTIGSLVAPGEAEAYHFCGHIYTTDSCPHPTGLPRIDSQGLPLMAADGRPVDDLGRYVDAAGAPVDEDGQPLTDSDGRRLATATRTRVCDVAADEHGFKAHIDGAWYRCCGGHVRKLVDCCGYIHKRINGDASLTGYCYKGRRVFCVMYFQTKVPC